MKSEERYYRTILAGKWQQVACQTHFFTPRLFCKAIELWDIPIKTEIFWHFLFFIFLIYLLIMLLQLSHFLPPSLHSILHTPCLPHPPPIVHAHGSYLISSLASTFPTLFLPFPCLFSTYHLCYLFSVPFPPSPPPTPLLTTLHVISISMVLFLF